MSLRGQPATKDEVSALVRKVEALEAELAELKRRPFRLLDFNARVGAGDSLVLVSTRTGFFTTIGRHV